MEAADAPPGNGIIKLWREDYTRRQCDTVLIFRHYLSNTRRTFLYFLMIIWIGGVMSSWTSDTSIWVCTRNRFFSAVEILYSLSFTCEMNGLIGDRMHELLFGDLSESIKRCMRIYVSGANVLRDNGFC